MAGEQIGRVNSMGGSYTVAAVVEDCRKESNVYYDFIQPVKLNQWDWTGNQRFHVLLRTDDIAAAKARHDAMGCVCFENPDMGIYFITDPDGYWLEILPPGRG